MGYMSQRIKLCNSCFLETFFTNFNFLMWLLGTSTGKTKSNQYVIKKLTVRTNMNLELFKSKVIAYNHGKAIIAHRLNTSFSFKSFPFILLYLFWGDCESRQAKINPDFPENINIPANTSELLQMQDPTFVLTCMVLLFIWRKDFLLHRTYI